MTDAKYLVPSAAIVLLMKTVNGKKFVLCQQRQNTGFADGLFDFSCSGKLEEGESIKDTAIREAREELGIKIAKDDLKFISFVHKRDLQCDIVYYNIYFACEKYEGEPIINEPNKCSQLKWFPVDGLPENMLDDRVCALGDYLKGKYFVEFGW